MHIPQINIKLIPLEWLEYMLLEHNGINIPVKIKINFGQEEIFFHPNNPKFNCPNRLLEKDETMSIFFIYHDIIDMKKELFFILKARKNFYKEIENLQKIQAMRAEDFPIHIKAIWDSVAE